MTTHRYDAKVNVRTKSGELVTVYPNTVGPAGMTAPQVHAAAHKAALAEVRGGTVEGSSVNTNGKRR